MIPTSLPKDLEVISEVENPDEVRNLDEKILEEEKHEEQFLEEEKLEEQFLEEEKFDEQIVEKKEIFYNIIEENTQDDQIVEENPPDDRVLDEDIFTMDCQVLPCEPQGSNLVEKVGRPKGRYNSKKTFLQRIVFKEQGLLLLAEKWKSQSQCHYYNLDILLNKVMTLNAEIVDTQERLRLIERDVEVTKKAYLLLNSSKNCFITHDHLSKKFSEYMVLEAKRRATYETLLNQRASYKTTMENMLKAEKAFQNTERKVKQTNEGVDANKVLSFLKVLGTFDSLAPGVYTATITQKSETSVLFLLDNGRKVKLPISKILMNNFDLGSLTPGTRSKICSKSGPDDDDGIFEVFPLEDSIWKDFDGENFSYLLRRDVWRE